MQTPRDHATRVNHKQPHNRVHFQHRPLPYRAEWYAILQPVLVRPERHQSCYGQARRDGKTLEIRRFSGGVFGDVAGRDVEACQSREAAKHEAG